MVIASDLNAKARPIVLLDFRASQTSV